MGTESAPPAGVEVFVSYTGADEAWATWVAAVLEAEGRTVAIQAWDSPAGTNFVAWINTQMTLAARTVAICSQAYFASYWCTQEWAGALAGNTLTPLRVEDCPIPPVLATIAYRDLYGVDETVARRRLVEALGLTRPARRSDGFPGGVPVGAVFPGRQPPDGIPAESEQSAAGTHPATRGRTGPGWLLAEVTDPFGLEVHRAIAVPTAGLPALPAYVKREHDRTLAAVVARAAAGTSQIAVLVGGSSTGKTRACWEALLPLRQRGEPWRLWHPIDPSRPDAALTDLPKIAPYTVVWLNEAQLYLTPDTVGEQIAAGLRALLREPGRGPVLILGTLWPEHWTTLTARPPTAPPDPHAHARELLDGHNIPVPGTFTGTDLDTVTAQAAHDPRLADATEHARDGQITQYLAGAPVLLDRYQQAPPATTALIHAAMDARRLGAGPHLPLAWLAQAAPGYLTDTTWEQTSDDWLHQALDYATTPCNGILGILTPVTTRTPRNQRTRPTTGTATDGARGAAPWYRLTDYLDQHGRRHRTDQIPPIDFWTAAATHAHPTDLHTLGDAAWDRGLYRDATQLHKHATTHGDLDAATAMIGHLHTLHPTDRRPAAHAAAHATLDEPYAAASLLRSLHKAGAQAQVAVLLARDPTADAPLHDPYAVASLLSSLHEVGAQEQLAVLLARDPAAHATLHDPLAITELLDSLCTAGAQGQVAVLLARDPTAHITLHDPAAVASLLYVLHDVLHGEGAQAQVAALLARDPAAHITLHDPATVAWLLDCLHRLGAQEQLTALANRAATHTPLDNPSSVAAVLDSLHRLGTQVQVTALANRAAIHTPLDNPRAVAELLDRLHTIGAQEQLTTLAERAATHLTLDNPYTVARRLDHLHKAGAQAQVAALLARDPAAHATLHDPSSVAELLDTLHAMGAQAQVTALANRAAIHTPLDNPYAVAKLLDRLHTIGAQEQLTTLADRLPAAGHFDQFLQINDHQERFRFGREPDSSAAAPWSWDDLE